MSKTNWKLDTELGRAGLKVVKLLNKHNFQAFWVGGIVRNILLKRDSDNIDIATDATPDEIENALNKSGIKTKPVGKEFGSILAIVDGYKIELTTFRAEGRYSDNRHPDKVEFIREYLDDAKRRDFTINALYLDPVKKELYDPVGGIKNLESRILKFVGDPRKRIDEDGLRMLRGVRLATQLGFKFERNSFAAIKTRAKYIQDISGERIKAELDKILLSENRAEGMRLLMATGLLRFIIPEFDKLKLVQHHAKTYHLEGDTATHTFKALEILNIQDVVLSYATLFHDVGKVISPQKVNIEGGWKYSYKGHVQLSGEIFSQFANKYKFPKVQKNQIELLIKYHDHRRWFVELSPDKQVEFFLNHPNPELQVELWRVDSGSNLRVQNGKVVWGTSASVPVALAVLKKIRNSQKLFHLASGDLIMKYSKLKPSKQLGQKIEEIKSQIVLGKIKNERDLKNFLKKS